MNTSLYQLSTEYHAAAERLADMDLDETTLADTLEGLADGLEVKAQNVAFIARNFEAVAEQIKAAEADMAKRRKALEHRAEGLRRYIQSCMQIAGISKIECPYFNLAIRDNPPSVVIDAESQIPAEFMRQPEPPPPAPDKAKIAAALKEGRDVPGAHLQKTQRLDIR